MKIEKEHKRATLMHKTKEELIDYIICLEHNNNVLQESFEVQYQNCVKIIDEIIGITKRYKESKKIGGPYEVEKG